MSTSTLALRFSLIYFGLLVVSLLLCRIVGRDSFALLNSMSLFAAVNLACFTYGKTNTQITKNSSLVSYRCSCHDFPINPRRFALFRRQS
jgi:hypothetical protein